MKIDRQRILDKYSGHCSYCGCELTLKTMQVDHLFPKQLNHKLDLINELCGLQRLEYIKKYMYIPKDINEFENLMPSCRSCNGYKNGNGIEMFRTNLKELHNRYFKNKTFRHLAIQLGIIIETGKIFDGVFYFERIKQLNKNL